MSYTDPIPNGSKCECIRVTGECLKNHPHKKCNKKATEKHHKNRSHGNEPSNIEYLCYSCHVNTRSYGQPLR